MGIRSVDPISSLVWCTPPNWLSWDGRGPRSRAKGRVSLHMNVEWIWWICRRDMLIGTELLDGHVLSPGRRHCRSRHRRSGRGAGSAPWICRCNSRIAGVLGVSRSPWWRTGGDWRTPRLLPQQSLDVGQAVHVQTWNADGTARVATTAVRPGTPKLNRPPTCCTRRSALHRRHARLACSCCPISRPLGLKRGQGRPP